MKKALLFTLPLMLAAVAFAQKKHEKATYSAVKFEMIKNDPFKDLPVGKFAADYYFAKGYGGTSRYWYEIVVIEQRLILHFHAAACVKFNKVDYEKEFRLSDEELKNFKKDLNKAALVQYLPGVPVPDTSASQREVFILRNGSAKIGGGRYHHTLFPSGMAAADRQKRINEEHKSTTSLKGDVDGAVKSIRGVFKALDSLEKASFKN